MSTRQAQLTQWVKAQYQASELDLHPLAKDASFRRYFKISQDANWLAVDAPPEHEKNHEFVAVAQAFAQMGIRVPQIKAYDLDQGFLLVENLGRDSYLRVLVESPELADRLYRDAIAKLVDIANVSHEQHLHLLHFDAAFMQAELDNFTQWYLHKYIGSALSPSEQRMLQTAYDFLIARAVAQPQVCIHRDYHSRNLIVRDQDNPGVIDFQDAMLGPLTYDLVSLLRDAYIAWPRHQVEDWAHYFYHQYLEQHPEYQRSWGEFLDDFNLMGIQRNLKAIFIFARKFLRDEDEGYLNDIPRTMNYILTVGQDYPELKVFLEFLENLK